MQRVRLSLLVKLSIIFLAVMVIPAVLVALYVKQQFDNIYFQNRFRNLDYGRTSLSSLIDEEWQSSSAFEQLIRDNGSQILRSGGAGRFGGKDLVLFSAQGAKTYESFPDCCPYENLAESLFTPQSLQQFLSVPNARELRMYFSQDRINLVYLFHLSYMDSEPEIVLIQSTISSYVFDALRRVSGLQTSIFFIDETDISSWPVESSGNNFVTPLSFTTSINDFGERIDSLSLSGEALGYIQTALADSDPVDDYRQNIFYTPDFISLSDDAGTGELVGLLPLLRTSAGLYTAMISIPRDERDAPEGQEYLWVIVSALFIILMLMSLLVTMYVVAPIITLNQGVENLRKNIGNDQGFGELPVSSNDEIGDLASSFNLLARELTNSLEKIRIQRREILEYAQNLEDKVHERTAEAERARIRAEMANIHKSQFLVNMNHEFRTPLNSISGITDLLSYGAYDKNDDMAVILEELIDELGEMSPPILGELQEFLYEEANPNLFLLQRLRDELEFLEVDEDQSRQIASSLKRFENLVLEEGQGKDKAYENIREAGKTLIHIVDDVINLSRIESGSIDIHPESSKLSEIVNYAMVHSESYCRAKGKTALLSLESTIEPSVPEKIFVDHYRIKQVLMNFMSNAIKYTESGSISLNVSYSGTLEAQALLFCVKDQGIGIDEKERHLIFAEFGRTFNVRDIEGTGLGLAISRKLVEAMNGKVGFSSEVGRGSEFWFTIPLTTRVEESVPHGQVAGAGEV